MDYKVYWDKGSHDNMNRLIPLAMSTHRETKFTVNYQNSERIIGSDYVISNGGTYKFWVSYLSRSQNGVESEMSNQLVIKINGNGSMTKAAQQIKTTKNKK